MLEVHAILQRQRCNENITKKTGTLSDAYEYQARQISIRAINDTVTSTIKVTASEE